MSLSQFVVLAECNLSARLFSLHPLPFSLPLGFPDSPILRCSSSQLSSHWRTHWTWLPANATNVEVVNCDGRQPQRQSLHLRLRLYIVLFLTHNCCLFRRLEVPANLAQNGGKARRPQQPTPTASAMKMSCIQKRQRKDQVHWEKCMWKSFKIRLNGEIL